mgnify:CR=1 FL=1
MIELGRDLCSDLAVSPRRVAALVAGIEESPDLDGEASLKRRRIHEEERIAQA